MNECKNSPKSKSAAQGKKNSVKSRSKGDNFSRKRSTKTHIKPDTEIKSNDYNDPSWMVLDQEMAQSCTAFTFNQFLGVPTQLIGPNDGDGVGKTYSFTNPAIMSVYLNPSAGMGSDILDPINQCALRMYTALSANNAKTTQYGPEDVIIAELALGEIVSLASFIMRVFGTAGVSNPRNRTWPVGIIKAMGINYDDFIANAEVYRSRYNLLTARAAAIVFPTNIDYFKACAALYNEIFLDSDSSMAQAIVTVPYSYWLLDEVGTDSGSVLKTKTYPFITTPNTKFKAVLDVFENMINTMLTSATLNYLYTDILKLAGETARFALPNIASGYVALPRFSEEFCIQLENCIVVGVPQATVPATFEDGTTSNDVFADAGSTSIRYKPIFKATALALHTSLMNFHHNDVTIDERIAALRFRPVVDQLTFGTAGSPTQLAVFDVAYRLPDHYVVQVKVGLDAESDFSAALYTSNVMTFTETAGQAQFNAIQSSALSSFRRAPILYIATTDNSDGNMVEVYNGTLCQLDYYTNVEPSAVKLFREMATYALYAPKGSFSSGK